MYLDLLVFMVSAVTNYLAGHDYAEYGESVAILIQVRETANE